MVTGYSIINMIFSAYVIKHLQQACLSPEFWINFKKIVALFLQIPEFPINSV